jgi:hypothetical protein
VRSWICAIAPIPTEPTSAPGSRTNIEELSVSILPRITRRPGMRGMAAIALVSSLVLGVGVSVGSASAAKLPSTPTAAAPHCLTRVIGQEATGEFRLSTPSCYATMADVQRNAGSTASGGSSDGVAAFGGDFVIGTHYDGSGFSGASISVVGSDCYGGYLNLTGWWANRVSSTANGCPSINHYYWPNLGGTHETTQGGGGNLWSHNNLSESISYTGW